MGCQICTDRGVNLTCPPGSELQQSYARGMKKTSKTALLYVCVGLPLVRCKNIYNVYFTKYFTFHDQVLSISRCISLQVKRLPRGSTGMPEQSFTVQVLPHPQQSSCQGLPPHQDTSTLSSASMPGRTFGPLNRKKCQRMSQPTTNSHTDGGSCQLQSGGELMWRK